MRRGVLACCVSHSRNVSQGFRPPDSAGSSVILTPFPFLSLPSAPGHPRCFWIPLGFYISLRAAFPCIGKLSNVSLGGVDCTYLPACGGPAGAPAKNVFQDCPPRLYGRPAAIVGREVLEECQLLLQFYLKMETHLGGSRIILSSLSNALTLET